jgi:histidyl-tRNA synthetase
VTSSTRPPGGTRDFLPDEIRRREHVIGVIRGVYERYGFEPLETPAFENIETLLGKYGEEGNKLIFKILRRGEHEGSGEADLALRYDLTVPLARVVAQYQNELPRLFKRYQIQPVWRADRPARGRFREFYQCDIDAMGSTSLVVEAELVSAVSDVLTALGFHDFEIRLNHRQLLAAVLRCAGVADELHGSALVALDKLDKSDMTAVAADLTSRGVSPDARHKCIELFQGTSAAVFRNTRETQSVAAANHEILSRVADLLGDDPLGRAALDELESLVVLSAQTHTGDRIRVDPSLARGLSYYTGAIMEIAVPDLPGSLGGGGRYDNLIGMFLGRDVPACGFSLGLERIILVMTDRGMFPQTVSLPAVDVVITFMDDASASEAIKIASELRASGIRVEVFPEPSRRLEKPLKHANARRASFLAIVGENERAKGEVAIKHLESRQQESVSRRLAANWITRRRSESQESEA